jgi:hypothetical protein
MPVTLPIEIYEAFEKAIGKEEAKAVIKSLKWLYQKRLNTNGL